MSGCAPTADTVPAVATPSVALSAPRAAPGGPLDVTYTFTVPTGAAALPADEWVFVHVVDERNQLLWTDDHAPSTPTQSWRAGTPVVYTRTMFVPRGSTLGAMRIEVGLFSRKSGERLPLAGNDRGMRSYEAATFSIVPGAIGPVVVGDGWYDAEAGDGPGREWQWSRKEGHLSFPNPKAPITLYLQVDQPVTTLPTSQAVEVRGPNGVLEAFTLAPGAPRVSKLPLSVDQLGAGDRVDLTVSVSSTLVPAAMPQLKSTDTRELGIRLLNAFVEPREARSTP